MDCVAGPRLPQVRRAVDERQSLRLSVRLLGASTPQLDSGDGCRSFFYLFLAKTCGLWISYEHHDTMWIVYLCALFYIIISCDLWIECRSDIKTVVQLRWVANSMHESACVWLKKRMNPILPMAWKVWAVLAGTIEYWVTRAGRHILKERDRLKPVRRLSAVNSLYELRGPCRLQATLDSRSAAHMLSPQQREVHRHQVWTPVVASWPQMGHSNKWLQ